MVEKDSPQKIPRLSPTDPSTSVATRWQAVVNRDASASGTFVYAVVTTKIYCRPSCPARLARRANVQFYDTPVQAEGEGFRPCKRCKPQQAVQAVNPQVLSIQKACETIEMEIGTGVKPSFRRLADEARFTPSHFHRVFKKVKGVTPGQYAVAVLKKRNPGGLLLVGDVPAEADKLGLFQSCAVDIRSDTCLAGGLEDVDILGPGDAGLWNDFDVLIAAEAGCVSGQEDMLPMDYFALPVVDGVDAGCVTDQGTVLSQKGEDKQLDLPAACDR